jgi:hypothetical protein
MTPSEIYTHAKPGTAIRITFGSRGSQLAIIHGRTRDGYLRVYKWRAKRRQWTGPLRVWPDQIIGLALAHETTDKPSPT